MSGLDTIVQALSEVLPSFSKSDGTIEAKIIDVVGSYADSETLERQNTVNTINDALSKQKITGKEYYRRKAIEFQLGDTLVYDTVNFGAYYDPVNVENRIVAQAYIAGSFPMFTLLVNGIGSDGHLRQLSNVELFSFQTYFEAFQPLGMDIVINSLEPAKIYCPNIILYVRAGSDAGDVIEVATQNLLTYESTFRARNEVSLTEIVDLFQQDARILAVSLEGIYAEEVQLDGITVVTSQPTEGLFDLTNGAFTFATEITVDNIRTL